MIHVVYSTVIPSASPLQSCTHRRAPSSLQSAQIVVTAAELVRLPWAAHCDVGLLAGGFAAYQLLGHFKWGSPAGPVWVLNHTWSTWKVRNLMLAVAWWLLCFTCGGRACGWSDAAWFSWFLPQFRLFCLGMRTTSLIAAGRPDGWGFQEIAAGRVSPFKAQVIGLLHAVQYLRGMGRLKSRSQLSVACYKHVEVEECVADTHVFSMHE